MKILFFSDAHGSSSAMSRLLEQIGRLNPTYIVFLGDALYHGPRNRILTDYNPRTAAEAFNTLRDRIVAVRGNCDSEVDQMLLEFPILSEYSNLIADKHRFFLSHGHLWNEREPPMLPSGSVLANGHTHVPFVGLLENGLILFNPGSIALPKEGHPPTFGLYENCRLSVLDLQTGDERMGLDLA